MSFLMSGSGQVAFFPCGDDFFTSVDQAVMSITGENDEVSAEFIAGAFDAEFLREVRDVWIILAFRVVWGSGDQSIVVVIPGQEQVFCFAYVDIVSHKKSPFLIG